MAQYREDFSGNSPVGPAPTGWTKRWHTSDMTVSTVADATAIGGVVMRIDVTPDSRCAITYDAVDSESPDTRADAEILFCCKSADVDASNSYTIASLLRGSGTDTTETGYRSFLYDKHGEYRPGYYNNASSTDIVTQQDAAFHFDADNNYWIWCRTRINGTKLYHKWWQSHETQMAGIHRYEPHHWQRSDTDSTISAAGWIGISLFDTAAGPWDVSYVGIGTNGDAAPYPGGADLETIRMAQQTVQVAVAMSAAEIRIKQQALHVLVQENAPAGPANPRRNIIIGM